MTKTFIMNSLIEKMQSQDQDFRFMGLNDLMIEIRNDPTNFLGEEPTENRVLFQVLKLVEDKISEVKNQAVKCLGQLIKIIREPQMDIVVDKLIDFSGGSDDELRDIASLALKTITSELPLDGKIAEKACGKLSPKLMTQIQNPKTPPETLIEILAILSILISRFPAYMTSPPLTIHPMNAVSPLLSHARPAVRKRATLTLATIVPISQPDLLLALLKNSVLPSLAPGANLDKQRTMIQLLAAMARSPAASQIAPELGQIIPAILKAFDRNDEELREGSFQALEALVLRCPTEVTPFLPAITQTSIKYIKYDPNYAGGDEDGDEEMTDADDDEGDDDDGDDAELDEYSDDEDQSYKIRRSATKLLAAIISTRPELLTSLYKEVSPILISRFGDREETVRLEIWATYGSLLTQTGVYGGMPQARDAHGKRKRDSDEGMDVEDTPYTLLRSQVTPLSKNLFAQLKPGKTSPTTLQAAFELLLTLLRVLPGCLASQVSLVTAKTTAILSQPSTSSTATLNLTCLSFLALFFGTHAATSSSSALPTLTPILLKVLNEKHPRVASECFRVFSALLNALKPVQSVPWLDVLYDAALERLRKNDTDVEVRSCAEEVIGDLWVCATEFTRTKGGKEWEAICRTAGSTDGAVKVVAKVAKEVDVGSAWVNTCVEWLMVLMRKSGKAGKSDVFDALKSLIRRYDSGVPADLPATLVPQVKHYIATTDIALMSHSLAILALLLDLPPNETFSEIEREILPQAYVVAHSPLVSGAALDSVLTFFASLARADAQIGNHVIPNLVISSEKAARSDTSPGNVAKCVAGIVRVQHSIAAGVIAEYAKNIKPSSKAKSSAVVLSLMILGEIGRFIDMSAMPDVFTNAITHFASEQEEIRSAAAFAAGNIAIGNLNQFLPEILSMVKSDDKKRLLSLHALKEVVTHCSIGQLEAVADLLWVPLFENSDNTEETTRNVAAACLGKLTTTHPSRYLPQLHARIRDENAASRATVISAVRYTFADNAQSYDDLMAPLVLDFLSLMLDSDLTVRRLTLSTLNSAARTKPNLIRDHLPSLLPSLYTETNIKPELIRTVQMGPWTHKVDDGLEARKTAYETMYTLLDTCLSKLMLRDFLGRVIPGLADDSDEIKVICHMMLFRLSQVAPASVSVRLDEATPFLEKTMKGVSVTKDTVKQDIERAAELQRSTLRAVAALSKIPNNGAPKFDAFVEELKRSPQWGVDFKEMIGA